jgi:hypothetical protein
MPPRNHGQDARATPFRNSFCPTQSKYGLAFFGKPAYCSKLETGQLRERIARCRRQAQQMLDKAGGVAFRRALLAMTYDSAAERTQLTV